MKNHLLTLFIFLQIFVTHLSTQTLPSYGSWVVTDSLKHSRGIIHSVNLPDGNVLATGETGGACEIYDIRINKWKNVDTMNISDALIMGLVLLDTNRVMALRYKQRPCEIYNIQNDEWELTDPIPVYRNSGNILTLRDGRIMILGGYKFDPITGDFSFLASVEIFDPMTNQWSFVDSMNYGRFAFTSTLLDDGRVLVTGGSIYKSGISNKTEIYNPETGVWRILDTMQFRRFEHSALKLNDGRVVVSGTDLNINPSTQMEVFDPQDETWSSFGSTIFFWDNPYMHQINADLLLFCEGYSQRGKSEIYDIKLQQTVFIDTMPGIQTTLGLVYKYLGTVTALNNKRYLNIGGVIFVDGFIGQIGTTFLYLPPGDTLLTGTGERKTKTIGAEELEIANPYPNPSNGSFMVHLKTVKRDDYKITMYDILGREVSIITQSNYDGENYRISFETSALTSGIYFLVFETSVGTVIQKVNILR